LQGYTGSIGYTGSFGLQGYTGSIGYTGSFGTTGYVGSVGYTGSFGLIGYTGSQAGTATSLIISGYGLNTNLYPLLASNNTGTVSVYADSGNDITYNPSSNTLAVVNITASTSLTVQGVSTSVSTITGSLQVVGGAGIGDSVYVGNRIGWANPTTKVSAFYTYYNSVTNSLDTIFG